MKNPLKFIQEVKQEAFKVAKSLDIKKNGKALKLGKKNIGYKLEDFIKIFSKIKEKFPHLHVKALTAAEINFLATEYNHSYEEIID